MPCVFELAILHLQRDSGDKVVVWILDVETTLLRVAWLWLLITVIIVPATLDTLER